MHGYIRETLKKHLNETVINLTQYHSMRTGEEGNRRILNEDTNEKQDKVENVTTKQDLPPNIRPSHTFTFFGY